MAYSIFTKGYLLTWCQSLLHIEPIPQLETLPNFNLPTISNRPISSKVTSKEITSLLRDNDMITVESIDEGIDQSESVSLDTPQIDIKFTSSDLNEIDTLATNTKFTINRDMGALTATTKYTISDLQDMAPKRAKVKVL